VTNPYDDPTVLPNPFVTDAGQDNSTAAPARVCDDMSFRNRKLSDLVSENDASVRLTNCIVHGVLPFTTIGEYLDAGDEASTILCKSVQNFGAKSARELVALVEEERTRTPRPKASKTADTATATKSTEQKRAELIERFGKITIGEFVADEELSVRLSNVLAHSNLRDKPLSDIFDGSSFTISSLTRFRNLGRKSADEFRVLLARLVAHRFREWGFDAAACKVGAQLLLGHLDAASLVSEALHPEATDGTIPTHKTLSDRIDWLLGELEPRSADILRRRFGIGGACAETLEEIGDRYSVTRERIRQIESKSLRQIRHRIRRAHIDGLLAAERSATWTTLSSGLSTLLREDLHEAKRSVDPYVLFALAVLEISLSHWLNKIATPFPAGWVVSEVDREAIERAAIVIKKNLDTKLLPRAATDFDASLDGATAEAACRLVLGLTVRDGYVLPARVGARLSRAIGLHAILAAQGHVLDLLELLSKYHSCFPNDLCSARDAEIVMEAASHLFLEIEDGRWLAVGVAGVAQPPLGAPNVATLLAEEPGTIAHALQVALRMRGPTRLGDLLDAASEILPEGRSINSIGPVLLMRHDLFIRLVPGVYGLQEHLTLVDALPESLLWLFNDHQARLYCVARFAGEPWGIFPFWTPKTEYRFCSWARHSGGPGTLNSLLAIAEISSWPSVALDKEQWLHLKRRIGRFEFGGTLRMTAAYERPDLDRVLAACIYAESVGSLNWIAANRICAQKIDAHSGAGMVALLVQLGALTEPELGDFAWQRRHQATPMIRDIVAPLTKELSTNGHLDWESATGKKLGEKVAATTARPGSWIDAQEVAGMFDGVPHTRPTDDEDLDPVEAILVQHRRNRETERREARLRGLLAEDA
jgi:hypothetical protein